MKFCNNLVAIIDSGLGGVSVLRQLISKFGYGNYLYFADNLYMPYGNRSNSFIKKRIDKIINLLKTKFKANTIIIACNTASSCVNKNEYENVFIMEFDNTKTYLATNLTKNNLSNYKVFASDVLAKQIEMNIYNTNKLEKCVKNCIKEHHLNNHKEIVLGCTHYELVANYFKKLAPNTKFVCNSEFLVEKIKISPTNELNVVLHMSKYSEKFYRMFKHTISF